VAQNNYDTLGLEAAYLAHGQSKRATECQHELDEFRKVSSLAQADNQAIGPGSIVTLSFENTSRVVFIGPGAAGLKVQINNIKIVVITPSAPLGKLLIGKYLFDVIEIVIDGIKTTYEISHCY
jgi:transcription elongation GreA/GreB family factor